MKFQILCEYEVKASEMKFGSSVKISLKTYGIIFTKMGKCQSLALEHHIKMFYVQNLRKNTGKPKLGTQNVL